MFERIIKSLKILWKLFLLALIFVPLCALIVIILLLVIFISGVIIAGTIPCAVIECILMFIWWIITGKSWRGETETTINYPLWSFYLWGRWVDTIDYVFDRLL